MVYRVCNGIKKLNDFKVHILHTIHTIIYSNLYNNNITHRVIYIRIIYRTL